MTQTAAGRIRREARVRVAVTKAAERWHALKHSGPFDRCPQPVCYNAHPLVIR
jgi:hypothetical protein